MTRVVRELGELRELVDDVRGAGRRVGVVPTMGALHRGHLALVEDAKRRADFVVVTVFVNPTQFGPQEDFEAYPRSLESDARQAFSAGADVVFAPHRRTMYPEGESTRVSVQGPARELCGASRPGHFEGVATVVAKLFNAIGPGVYVFGRKDFQQWRVIERLARDLLFPVEVIGHPLVRDADGLALSSRNAYLSPAQRRQALALPRALMLVEAENARGIVEVGELRRVALAELARANVQVDYVEFTDPDGLEAMADEERVTGPTLCALAAFVGSARLIDNMVLGQDAPPKVALEEP